MSFTKAVSLVGPDVASWLAYSSHCTRAGAGNQRGEHGPVRQEPHLAPGSNRPDGEPTGEQHMEPMNASLFTYLQSKRP